MRSVRVVLALLLSAAATFAQTDRSTITGTIIDPAGAVVANAGIEVRNPATGALFTIGTSNTGNYTVTVPAAFEKYVVRRRLGSAKLVVAAVKKKAPG